jgi:hypothetical protein
MPAPISQQNCLIDSFRIITKQHKCEMLTPRGAGNYSDYWAEAGRRLVSRILTMDKPSSSADS